jgi:sulfatase modifying factor 1
MACIPGGTFMMGSPIATPIHQVTLGAFLMDLSEVTVSQYAACVAAGVCSGPMRPGRCDYGVPGRDDHPVNCIDWSQATVFCQWAGKRLPTEEEWEYAARSRGRWTYPWGDTPPNATRVNHCGDECRGGATAWGGDEYPETAPVDSFPGGDTAEGLHDMDGNVWEWCASPYCDYPDSPCNACPASRPCAGARCSSCDAGLLRGIRGASWGEDPTDTLFQQRGSGYYGADYIGFRCAR